MYWIKRASHPKIRIHFLSDVFICRGRTRASSLGERNFKNLGGGGGGGGGFIIYIIFFFFFFYIFWGPPYGLVGL
jgi:hypothetical protein